MGFNPSNRRVNTDRFDKRIAREVNKVRRQRGLDTLRVDSQLDQAIDYHLVKTGYDHRGIDGSNPTSRARKFGYRPKGNYVRENLYWEYGYGTKNPEALAKRVVRGWLGSSGHRRAMLNENIEEIGVGVVRVDGGFNNELVVGITMGDPI